jgi:GntR family transcriptional regulator, transcriptional repressor for pyruvate dehydrogenase complex
MKDPLQNNEPLKIPPAYEIVVDRLRRAIHLGLYRSGEKLPPERVHATELGVSRVTLREAIRVLEGEGYLRTKRGSMGGVTVLEQADSHARVLQRLREEYDEISAIGEFRVANEGLAAERATSRMTPADLKFLADSIEELRASTTIGDFRHADSLFHLGIARAADSAMLRRAVEDARVAMFMPMDVVDLQLVHDSSVKDHRKILRAFEAGDAKAARRHMTTHLARTNAEIGAIVNPS